MSKPNCWRGVVMRCCALTLVAAVSRTIAASAAGAERKEITVVSGGRNRSDALVPTWTALRQGGRSAIANVLPGPSAGVADGDGQGSRHAQLAVGVVEPLAGRVRIAAPAAATDRDRRNPEADRHVGIG